MSFKVNRIVHGDCVTGLGELDPGCVDLAFADPPFNIGYEYDAYNDRRTRHDYLNWSRQWISQVKRALKPSGTFWLAIGDEYAAELRVLCTNDLGLICRSWVVWYYTFGVHCSRKFARSHAHLFHFVKSAKHFTFNADAIRVPSARQLVYADKRANPKGRVPDDTWIIPPKEGESAARITKPSRARGQTLNHRRRTRKQLLVSTSRRFDVSTFALRPQDLPDGFAADSDTWYFPRVCGTFKERAGFHGCQMPEQLLGRIIKVSSNENDLVLDPFVGTGTTLAVAKKLSRNYIGFEISKKYVSEAEARLRAIKRGDPLDGAEDPLRSVPPTSK